VLAWGMFYVLKLCYCSGDYTTEFLVGWSKQNQGGCCVTTLMRLLLRRRIHICIYMYGWLVDISAVGIECVVDIYRDS